jgi:NhaA family Na+:H+ antiporter
MLTAIQDFLRHETAGGIVLMLAAGLALLVVNSPLGAGYDAVLTLPVRHAIDDGLMAVFFLLVSLEIKRELVVGELSTPAQAALPAGAALGGMLVPALIYVAFNVGSPANLRGWAIPSATDIAFSLGVLSLLGRRVPASLKVFLAALAILDDLGAIVIIALFYTADLSLPVLGLAGLAVVVLVLLGRRRASLWLYLPVGLFLWDCLLKSGVHATLAGVAVGLAIPVAQADRLERGLHPYVSFAILPLFAFANAGLRLSDLSLELLTQPLLLGIAAGLFVGKQVGVFAAVGVMIRLCGARLPDGASWRQLYGAAVLTGIGFTMSLFIGALAFPGEARAEEVRFGVVAGSLASALLGALVLRLGSPLRRGEEGAEAD